MNCIRRLNLPSLYEGIVTFIMTVDNAFAYSVPCCVVPPKVKEDIETLFTTMVSVTRSSMTSEVTKDEPALIRMVWNESFTAFLADIDLLFEWLRDRKGPATLVLKVLVNMLRQCCKYDAWEFGAYVLNKASECGLSIISMSTKRNMPLTAESLKAEVSQSSCQSTTNPSVSVTGKCLLPRKNKYLTQRSRQKNQIRAWSNWLQALCFSAVR